ncbi:hypothetical protein [Marinospirillum insulare]|uniref:Uncharacterized protein n=1 Tax=Marinospirillum insulare TaxID=217169 RepID=A0ABQ5ZVN7_9GAMM|nr:hypothetical protein [Marinospirillum insulare]GLR64236.1 hypothetical protein GCM10007878_16740 [Marinospirillum insulare]
MNALAKMQEKEIFLRSFFENSFFENTLFGTHLFELQAEHRVAKNLKKLEEEWLAITHVKQIPILLNQHETTYFAALCSFSPRLARSVSLNSFEQLITQAKAAGLPLSLTLFCKGSKHTTHQAIISKQIKKNCLCLNWQEGHAELEPSQFEFAFISRVPCSDGCGWINSLEIFGADGELLLQIQGSCEDQQAENLKLREIFSSLV